MIDIVILNLNKRQALLAALESVFSQREEKYRIIVVDNASTDGSAEAVMSRYGGQVTLLKQERNLGGTGGFNAGVRLACRRENDAIFLMDNDVVLDREALSVLRAALDEYPTAGAVGPKIYYSEDPDRIWCCGGIYRPMLMETTHRGGNRYDGPAFMKPRKVPYLPACALLVRRPVVDMVGLMDERFFIYNDDVDWCLRIHRAGWDIRVEPGAKAWHDITYRTATINSRIAYYSIRNHGLLLSVHCRNWQKWIAGLLLPWIAIKRELLFTVASRAGGWPRWMELNRAAWQGILDWRSGHFGERQDLP